MLLVKPEKRIATPGNLSLEFFKKEILFFITASLQLFTNIKTLGKVIESNYLSFVAHVWVENLFVLKTTVKVS